MGASHTPVPIARLRNHVNPQKPSLQQFAPCPYICAPLVRDLFEYFVHRNTRIPLRITGQPTGLMEAYEPPGYHSPTHSILPCITASTVLAATTSADGGVYLKKHLTKHQPRTCEPSGGGQAGESCSAIDEVEMLACSNACHMALATDSIRRPWLLSANAIDYDSLQCSHADSPQHPASIGLIADCISLPCTGAICDARGSTEQGRAKLGWRDIARWPTLSHSS
ncbi:MAG: hypothetical protein FWD57_08790 [Polyangiaceae bacterium]|nr:hypothetical protein [Polyangiaceae bacterium]